MTEGEHGKARNIRCNEKSFVGKKMKWVGEVIDAIDATIRIPMKG